MAGYLPTESDEAKRDQLVSRFFWTAGDIFAGTDTVLRVDPGTIRNDGLLGAPGSPVSYGVAPDGGLYVRGSAGTIGAATVNTTAATGGLVLTPGLLLLAGLAFLVFRKG